MKKFPDEKFKESVVQKASPRTRAIDIGRYILETGSTVRAAAKEFGISKSTVHADVTKKLMRESPELAGKVRKILELNKEERHIRGGEATREKFSRLKKNDVNLQGKTKKRKLST